MNMKISEFVGSRIRSLRRKHNLTQKELGEKLGVKHNTISSYEKGTNEPEQDTLFRMADVLGVSINDFFPYEEKLNALKSSEYRYLPTTISAGLPITVDGITESEKIRIPDALMGKWAGHKDILIMRINGDSMDKTMPDGSIIAVKSMAIENLKDGDIVVYSVNHDYSVKRLIKRSDSLVFRPHSTDISFTDDIVSLDNKDLKIHGKVVLYIVEMD